MLHEGCKGFLPVVADDIVIPDVIFTDIRKVFFDGKLEIRSFHQVRLDAVTRPDNAAGEDGCALFRIFTAETEYRLAERETEIISAKKPGYGEPAELRILICCF